MKAILFFVSIAVASSAFAAGSKFNSGYIRRDGTYVQPHFKSAPNSTKFDNYSTAGTPTHTQGSRAQSIRTPCRRHGTTHQLNRPSVLGSLESNFRPSSKQHQKKYFRLCISGLGDSVSAKHKLRLCCKTIASRIGSASWGCSQQWQS